VNLTLTLSADQLAEIAQQVAPLVLAELEPEAADSPWLSVTAAADYLSVSERTIERAIERGRLRSSTLGRRRLLHRDDLDTLARSNGDGGGSNASHSTPPPSGSVE
jgi:excisionase family DNA binding protein